MAYINNSGQVRVGVRGWVAQTTTSNVTDVDAASFITAAGITDTTQISALNTLVNDLKTYGLWTKIKALYPFVGGSATSHKFNLKDPRDLDAGFRLQFNGGWAHSSTGAKPNGTTGYAETYLNNNILGLNNISFGVYLGENNTISGDYVGASCAIGAYGNGGWGSGIYPGNNTSVTYYFLNGSASGGLSINSGSTKGMYIVSKISTTSFIHTRGSFYNPISFNTQVLRNTTFKISKAGEYAGDYNLQEQRLTYIGDGLYQTEISNLYIAIQKFQTTLGRHVGTPYVSDPDAITFLMAAGITDGTQAAAINTLVIRMKADGVWTKMKAIYPFVGGNATSHKFNLKDPRDLDAAYRLVFNGGWVHSSTGAKPNGTTGWADTKLSPSTRLTQWNTHLSFYSRTSTRQTSSIDMGSADGLAVNIFALTLPRTTGNGGSTQYSQTNASEMANASGLTDASGFWLTSRTSNIGNTHKFSKNGIILATASTSAGNLVSQTIKIACLEANYLSNKETCFNSIGDGLTDIEASNLYNAVQAYQTTLGRQVNVPLVSDTDAQAFLNVANITSFQQASAVNKLVVDLKAAGVWTKMKAIYPFVGGSATSHKWNLKDPRDLDAAYRLVFNGGWTHTGTGAQPNGTTGYADTKLKPNNMAQNSAHMSTYLRTYNENGIDIGSNTINRFWISANIGTGLRPLGLLNVVPFEVTGPNLDTKAFLLASRTDSTTNKLFRNSSLIYNETAASSTPDVYNIYLGAVNVNNGGSQYSYREQAFASIGDGLTDAEATAFYNAVQTYQTSLGRAVNTPVYNNGLVLNLDAGNSNSYPGTGTTWFDLASGNNGTLFSGITYDVNNGGGLIFNGSNQYISSFNNTNLNFTSSDKFTISCFFKATSTSSFLGLVVSGNTSGEWNYGIWVTDGKIQVGTHNNNRVGNSTIVIGQIYQATLTYSNNTMKVYLNGINDGTFTSFSLFNGLNQQLVIGRKGANAANYFPGTVYNVQIYNRELSATEILNNFNSSRGRFGL
jgi:hypothetical protein